MNKDRRKSIEKNCAELAKAVEAFKLRLGELQADFGETFADLRNAIEQDKDDEQEYKDNMPESMQDGEKGQAADQAIEYLDAAYEKASALADVFEDDTLGIAALDEIDEALSALNDAAGV